MYAVEKLSSYITRGVYTVSGPFHPFGGAVDIIVVQQQDGSFKSSPWYVRFGKFQGVLKTKEKVVAIAVNGTEAGFHMYLDHKGEAYFLKEAGNADGESADTSPSSTSGDETDGKSSGARITKSQSCDVEAGRSTELKEVDGQMVVGTNSRRSGILGMMFGRRSVKEIGGNAQRASSLERAEIAADLLDTKWSTNLPANDPKGDDRIVSSHSKVDDNLAVSAATEDHFEEVNAHNSESLGVHEEVQDVASSDQMTLELGNVNGHSLSSLGAVDGIQDGSSHVNAYEIGESSHPGLKGEACEELVSLQGEHSDDSLRISVISEVHIEEKITESSGERTLEEVIEITTLEADDLTGESGLIYETVMTESKEFEVSPEGPILKNASFYVRSHGTSPKSHDSEQAFHESYDASVVEKGGKEVLTLSYSLSANDAQEALDLPFCPSKQFEHQGEVSCTEVSSEKLQPESSQHDDNGNVDACPPLNSKISTTEDSFLLNKPRSSWPSNEVFEDAMTNDFYFDSPVIGSEHTLTGSSSSHNPDLIFSESKVPCHEGETLNSAEENKRSLEPTAFHVNQPEMNGSPPEMNGSPITGLNTLILTPKSVQPLHSNDSEIPDSSDQVQETANLGKGYEGKNFCLSKGDDFAQKLGSSPCSAETMKTRVPSSESIEDDQFLLDDIDGFDAKGTNAKQFSNGSAGNADNRRLLTSECDSEECDMKSVHDALSSENIYETLGTQTSPMIIPRNHTHLAESELLIRSLPLIRSHVHDLEPSNLLHPLSCSLNINSTRNKHSFLEHEMSNSSVLEVDSESNMLDGHHLFKSATAIDPEKWGDQRGTSINPDVELSLCRHLLFEGMGADAASQAFNAEKAQIFEPQGMIAVDGPGNLLSGGAMGEMVPSGGSWRLWPFTFRKSKTITTVRSTREGTIVADVDTASEGTKNSTGISGAQKTKTAKKREQSLTPTSEELESLNLKEGSNEITFTFSTAMLGRQQVDCRIYLWKWNTRIVISDVDGTITKSDVLGQFMPLVGVDWSQTGVAHLFSAIKDGKALPDGPVVISPDGLFPSLYREVIRRAPHEFKISCLEDIKALFPRDCSPFYAGFGNRDTDEISYLKVGIPKGKIFIINPKGQVAVNRRVATKSYSSLHALVNGMFPPMSSAEQEDFNSWNYWKLPLPDIDV